MFALKQPLRMSSSKGVSFEAEVDEGEEEDVAANERADIEGAYCF